MVLKGKKMISRWAMVFGCLFLVSCSGNEKKDVRIESLLPDGDGEYVDLEGVVKSIEIKSLSQSFMGLKYPPEVIKGISDGGHIFVGLNANFQVALTDIVFIYNPLGFSEVTEFYFHIHSPSLTFMSPDRPIGERVKMRLYYDIEEDGMIYFSYAYGWTVDMVVVDK